MLTAAVSAPIHEPHVRPRGRILLIESDAWEASLVEEALGEMEENQQYWKLLPRAFDLFHAETLPEAIETLEAESYDIILLALPLPGPTALHSFLRVRQRASQTPVIVLCSELDESLAITTVREGAFAYLLKEDLDCLPLARTLRSALERKQLMLARNEMPLTDELTGLLSRSGFTLLADQAVRLGSRWRQPVTLFLIELTGYELPVDTYGDQAHDLALVEASDILRGLFSGNDIVCRLHGDRFAVLCFDDQDPVVPVETRLRQELDVLSAREERRQALAFVVGSTRLAPTLDDDIDRLLRGAEEALCENKRKEFELAL